MPALADCESTGQHIWNVLGGKSHVVDLNAAGSEVARQAGWHIVDMDEMAGQFDKPRQYLRDVLHPRAWFLLEVLIVYLNVWWDNCASCTAPEDKLWQVDAAQMGSAWSVVGHVS
jgi:hypothetical protein